MLPISLIPRGSQHTWQRTFDPHLIGKPGGMATTDTPTPPMPLSS